MSNYKLKDSILEQVIIENNKAICKVCGVSKPIRGIATHIFRKHTEKGLEHTNKVCNTLADYAKASMGQVVECEICNSEFSILTIKIHRSKCLKKLDFEHQVLDQECAACGNKIEKVIGSGLYCSISCSKGRHARTDLESKNKKIKETYAKKRQALLIDVECQNCKKIMKVPPRRRNRKFCSRKCQVSTPAHIESMTRQIRKHIESGAPYPKGIKCEFHFNDKIIKCDSKLEWICLKWFAKNYQVQDIERSSLWLTYRLDNFDRRYNPDFKIILTSSDVLLVEAKMEQSETTRHNFSQYQKESHVKKDILEEYCNLNKIKSIWFTQKTDSKFYRKACLEFDNTIRKRTV